MKKLQNEPLYPAKVSKLKHIGGPCKIFAFCMLAALIWHWPGSRTTVRRCGSGGLLDLGFWLSDSGPSVHRFWAFVSESMNGTEDIWQILEGQGYPRLWWELIS